MIRAAPILVSVSVSVSGRYCCFHEVSESANILLQIPMGLIHKSRSRLRSEYTRYINRVTSVLRSAVWYTLYRGVLEEVSYLRCEYVYGFIE